MRKIYKKLTKEQMSRGIIFSSTLSTHKTELDNDTIHEVSKQDFRDDSDKASDKVERLKNDKFFNASHYKYNIIRT